MRALGLRSHVRPQDVKLERYARAFYRTPLYSHAAWALVAASLLAVFLRSRRPEAPALAGLMAAALAFAASFALIGVACDYRYLYALDLAGLTGLFWCAVRLPYSHSMVPGGLDVTS